MSDIQYILSKALEDKRVKEFNNLKKYIRQQVLPQNNMSFSNMYVRMLENAKKAIDKTMIAQVNRTHSEPISRENYPPKIPFETGWNFDSLEEIHLKIIPILDEINQEWEKIYPGTKVDAENNKFSHMIEIFVKVLPLSPPSSKE